MGTRNEPLKGCVVRPDPNRDREGGDAPGEQTVQHADLLFVRDQRRCQNGLQLRMLTEQVGDDRVELLQQRGRLFGALGCVDQRTGVDFGHLRSVDPGIDLGRRDDRRGRFRRGPA